MNPLGQILCHLWGDYILQSYWMAQNKTKSYWAAFVHATVYTSCFVPLLRGHKHWFWLAATIGGTHFVIDRFRLARYLVWMMNWLAPTKPWFRCPGDGRPYWTDVDEGIGSRAEVWPFPPLWACPTGYPPNVPIWLSSWLLIISDNTLHLTINFIALTYL